MKIFEIDNPSRSIELLVLLGAIILTVMSGCAPIFSNFQSAETVGDNNVEVTPFTSGILWHVTEITETPNGPLDIQTTKEKKITLGQQNYGLKFAYGLDPLTDLRLELGTMASTDKLFNMENFGEVNMISAGPKISILDTTSHNVALNLTLSKFFRGAFEEFSEGIFLKPGIIYSYTKIDQKPTLAFKLMHSLPDGENSSYVVNLGIQASNKPIVRPEVGMLIGPEFEDPIFQLGVAFSFRYGQ